MITISEVFDSMEFFIKSVKHNFSEYRRTTNEIAVVKTEYGKVEGCKRITIYGDEYFSFEKIPYAQPPINELRFKAPKRPKPWKGVLDCTKGNVRPLQTLWAYNKVGGTEDCLYLNVYTNNLEPKNPRPVMIWIYGGSFTMGEASRDYYSPDLLMKKNIVLVTINYRLGPLGFLSLNDPELDVPGNAGLKDQVLAIKWVKQNCSRFGGNPDNITVFGESAGGASTNFLCITDKTKDLFHRAILMSGCVTTPWALTEKGNYAYRLAKAIGYSGESNEKHILEFLLKADAHDLIGLEMKLLTPEELADGALTAFGPIIEPYISKKCVIPTAPTEMLKTAWSNAIPLIVGSTSFEGLWVYPFLRQNPQMLDALETCVSFVPKEVITDRDSMEALKLGRRIKKTHVEGESEDDRVTSYLEIMSYKQFLDPIHRLILARFKYSKAPTYLYRFDFESSNLVGPYYIARFGKCVSGVSHTDELSYLFNTLMGSRMNTNSEEYKTIERMTALWTHFALNGDPNSKTTESVKWKPLNKNDKTHVCLNISSKLKIKKWPEMDKVKVWESMYPKELLFTDE